VYSSERRRIATPRRPPAGRPGGRGRL